MPGGDQEPGSYYVGVDVGTGSVRAALVDQRGIILAFADQPINRWEPQFNHHEQSSEDIWAACCVVTKVWPQLWRSILVYAPLLPPAEHVCFVHLVPGTRLGCFRYRPCLSGVHSLVAETSRWLNYDSVGAGGSGAMSGAEERVTQRGSGGQDPGFWSRVTECGSGH